MLTRVAEDELEFFASRVPLFECTFNAARRLLVLVLLCRLFFDGRKEYLPASRFLRCIKLLYELTSEDAFL